MSPEDRQKVKNDLLPKWQQMTPDRRQAINGRLHTLQGMSAPDRQKALDDPKFMQGLNPDEQVMLRDLEFTAKRLESVAIRVPRKYFC